MTSTRTLQHLVDAGVPLTSEQAVAIVQALIASADSNDSSSDDAAPSIDRIHIDEHGHARIQPPTKLTVAGAASLLDAMLPHAPGVRVPGALKYIVARALGQVDAPSFSSIGALSGALSRHEHRDRATTLRELYATESSAVACPSKDLRLVPHRTAASRRCERRIAGPSVDALRRQLRALEGELYRAQIQIQSQHGICDDRVADRQHAPADVCNPILVGTIDGAEHLRREIRPDAPSPPRRVILRVVGAVSALIVSFLVGYAAGQYWRSRRTEPVDQAIGSRVSELNWSVVAPGDWTLGTEAQRDRRGTSSPAVATRFACVAAFLRLGSRDEFACSNRDAREHPGTRNPSI